MSQHDAPTASADRRLLEPHGGDLNGFVLLRGDADKLHRIRTSEEFLRLNARSGLVVQNFGVVDAYIGGGLARQLALFEAQLAEVGA